MVLFDEIRQRKTGWNGYDAPAPDPTAIEAAEEWLKSWWGEPTDNWEGEVDRPHIGSSAGGEVVLEWRRGEQCLTAYVHPMRNGNFHIDYVKSWGPDIATEMEDGELTDDYTWVRLWNWLWNNGRYQ